MARLSTSQTFLTYIKTLSIKSPPKSPDSIVRSTTKCHSVISSSQVTRRCVHYCDLVSRQEKKDHLKTRILCTHTDQLGLMAVQRKVTKSSTTNVYLPSSTYYEVRNHKSPKLKIILLLVRSVTVLLQDTNIKF